MNLFTYGTLMFPEIWRRVVGRDFATLSATLVGYAVYRVRNGVYPVLVAADAGSQVRGLVYQDVDAGSLARLDEYESELYDRAAVIAFAGEQRIECETYLLPEARRSYASEERWDADRFKSEALADYLRRLTET
jgi:gamma-glutamylcyclotransferase (GGCT)/AIG2-like uncharacterized protein YtfP